MIVDGIKLISDKLIQAFSVLETNNLGAELSAGYENRIWQKKLLAAHRDLK